MTEETEVQTTEDNGPLITLDKVNITNLFTKKTGLKKILTAIEDATAGFVPDLSTLKGREEIAGLAYKISRSKTLLDKAGTDLTKQWRDQTKQVNDVRKEITAFCDELRDRVRAPLTEWEAEQKRIEAEEQAAAQMELDHEEALKMNDNFDRIKDLEAREAKLRAREAELGINRDDGAAQGGELPLEEPPAPEAGDPGDATEALVGSSRPQMDPDPAGAEKALHDSAKVAWVFYLMNKHMREDRFKPGILAIKDAMDPKELEAAREVYRIERAKHEQQRSS